MGMIAAVAVLLFLLSDSPAHGGLIDFDMGLIENNPLMIQLCKEDRLLQSKLVELQAKYNISNVKGLSQKYFAQMRQGSEKSAEEYVSHPINAFKVIKRASMYLPLLKKTLEAIGSPEAANISSSLDQFADQLPLFKTVNQEDFFGSTKALIFIIHAYNLDIRKLRKGLLDTTHIKTDINSGKFQGDAILNCMDLTALAKESKALGLINTSIKLMREAYAAKAEEEEEAGEPADPRQTSFMDKLRKQLVRTNNDFVSKRKTYVTDGEVVYPFLVDDNLTRKKTQPKIVRSGDVRIIDYQLVQQHGGDFFLTEAMLSGCRGEFKMGSTKVNKQWDTQYPHLNHKCRLLHHGDPFLKMAPFKMEVASVVPFIIVVHEVLTDEDSDHLVELSRPLLSRSRHLGAKPAIQKLTKQTGKNRVVHKSVQVWLNDTVYHDNPYEYRPDNITINDERMWAVYKRMELAFNLDVKSQWSSHQSQVTNYGIGGLCEQHMDSQGYYDGSSTRMDKLENQGDYIATIMAWLGNTPAGGVTSFFRGPAEALVYPTKGSAAFWWDIYQYGGRDQGTTHGGCPVAMGTKWILNKWVYSHNQWNRYPCRLSMQETTFTYPHLDNIGPYPNNRFF